MRFPFRACLRLLPALACVTLLAPPPAAAQGPQKGYRKLAPGVETTIPIDVDPEETVSKHDVVELHTVPGLKWTPNFTPESRTLFELSADVPFRRSIWNLQLTFKPLRMMYVDVPQPTGKMQRKLIWYMVYRVKNLGGHLEPEEQPDGTFVTKPVDKEVRFLPHFVLETYDGGTRKAYLDRVIPVAVAAIQNREDPNRTLLNSAQMSEALIPLSTKRVDRSVWGLVTWEDVDPRIDHFSVFVQGLTNAYKWVDPPGVYKPGDPPGRGRRFARKTLRLNFWRPGDQHGEHEEEIRFGVPIDANGARQARILERYQLTEPLDHLWVYR